MVREVYKSELSNVLELYLHLHEETIPEMTEHLQSTWNTIMQEGKLVISRIFDIEIIDG